MQALCSSKEPCQWIKRGPGGPLSLCIYTNHSKQLIRHFGNKGKMAEVFWISHGMTLLCSNRAVVFYHFNHLQKAIFISVSHCVAWTVLFQNQPHIIPSVVLSCFYSTCHKYSVLHVHLWWMVFLFLFFSPPKWTKSISSAEQRFLKRTTRTDACQAFPDALKQWLHSWQIPLILNLIRHWTVAHFVLLCCCISTPLFFCLLSLCLSPRHLQLV